jgi:hypothetical protein
VAFAVLHELTTTLVVLGGLGLDVSGETVPYVAGWGEDGALEAVTTFATTIDDLARRLEGALATAAGPVVEIPSQR